MDCEALIYREDCIDFLIDKAVVTETYADSCRQPVGPLYDSLYVVRPEGYGDGSAYGYYNLPKLYGLLDSGVYEKTGVRQVSGQPGLQLSGKDILLGFVDTGIDYTGSIFRRRDGTTRIVSIWDQTIPGAAAGKNPASFNYGSEYTQEEMNQALASQTPYDLVPSEDRQGHGTYLASVAAGNSLEDQSFRGVAPEADIAVVKLKPAKKNLREYYQVQDTAEAYQENDIMAGIAYLTQLAESRGQPMVICVALGTNAGSHSGLLPLARTIDLLGSEIGVIIVAGTGNETTRAHHYRGVLGAQNDYQDVELRAAQEEKGFVLELWGRSPEIFSVAIRSPEGEVIPRIYVRPARTELLPFLLSETKIEISYRISVVGSGEFLIVMRFLNVSPGLWTIRVYNDLYINGQFDLWLPMDGFLMPDTVFLSPSADSTLTAPSDAFNVIAAGTWQYQNDSIYLYSGRGNTLDNRIRPDLAAPGTDLIGYVGDAAGEIGDMRSVARSGSSAAAAYLSGAAALLAQWAVNNGRYLNSADARAYFIRGAQRNAFQSYPNREWGFGSLDLYGVFRSIDTQQL